MKINLIVGLPIAFLILCSQKKSIISKKEIYENKTQSGTNYIELTRNGSYTSGIFYGVELNKDSILIYFKSEFSFAKSDKMNASKKENEFYFKLTKFLFSYHTFYLKPSDKDLVIEGIKIPVILHGDLGFFGEYKDDTIILNRVADMYDGRADEMIFHKVIR